MANPYITFEVKNDASGVAHLSSQLHTEGLDNNDIRMRFARLGMRYATQVGNAGALPISEVSAGDHISASIEFTQNEIYGDGDEFYQYDEDDDDYEGGFYNTPEAQPVDENAIGFRLKINGLGDPDGRPFGWAASPAAIAATQVSKMIRTAIEQAAGVSCDQDNDAQISGPGL